MYRIGVFDSGIGGASVLKELLQIMPNEEYVYLSDSINNPYGDKKSKELLTICEKNVEFLLDQGCNAIVIACNTASAKTSKYLRKNYKEIPIYAIEPAYKMVYDFSYENPTLVMATKGTIESERFNDLYNKYDNHKTYLISCIGLADAIEKDDKEEVERLLNKYLKKYQGVVKNVVLGCTHYAFITEEIKKILGDVEFFYGANALAKHVKEDINIKTGSVINEKEEFDNNIECSKYKLSFFDTSNSSVKKNKFKKYILNK